MSEIKSRPSDDWVESQYETLYRRLPKNQTPDWSTLPIDGPVAEMRTAYDGRTEKLNRQLLKSQWAYSYQGRDVAVHLKSWKEAQKRLAAHHRRSDDWKYRMGKTDGLHYELMKALHRYFSLPGVVEDYIVGGQWGLKIKPPEKKPADLFSAYGGVQIVNRSFYEKDKYDAAAIIVNASRSFWSAPGSPMFEIQKEKSLR